MKKLTPQQQAAANAKRTATMQANRANGTPTVRQQRAAKRAAKAAAAAGQTYTPPAPPPPPRATSNPFRRRRRGFSSASQTSYAPPANGFNAPRGFGGASTTTPPVFATPKPTYRALKLAALVALEAAFTQRLAENGITQDAREAWDKYKKMKAHALAANPASQTEADSFLRMATVHLVKLAF